MTANLPGQSNRRSALLRMLVPMAMALGLATCTSGNSTPTSYSGARGTGVLIDSEGMADAGIKKFWYRQPFHFSGKSQLANFWNVGNTLYIASTDNLLIAMDAVTGRTLWQIDLGNLRGILRPAEYPENLPHSIDADEEKNADQPHFVVVFNNTAGVLIDSRIGKIVQRATLPFACATSPITTGGTISVGSGADFFYGLHLDNVDVDGIKCDAFAKMAWPVRSEAAGDSFVSQPVVVVQKRLIFASEKGRLFCVDSTSGKVLWTYRKVTGQVVGGLAIDGQRSDNDMHDQFFYVPSMDHKVYAFDAVDGSYIWDTHLEGTLDQTLVAAQAGRLLLAPSTGKGLYCLETDRGVPKWTLPGMTQIVSLSATHVYVVGTDGAVKAVNLDTGAIDKSIPLAAVKQYATNLQSSTIYAITAQGEMMAIEP